MRKVAAYQTGEGFLLKFGSAWACLGFPCLALSLVLLLLGMAWLHLASLVLGLAWLVLGFASAWLCFDKAQMR